MIEVEFRRTLFSEQSDVRPFLPGSTVAEIVAAFDTPAEFQAFGGVYLKASPDDAGHMLEREYWHRVRPKDGTALFVSCIPHGGGGGEGGKQIFQIVAAIALIALTAWVGGGGLFLAPSLAFVGAGTPGAAVAAAAIGADGVACLSVTSSSQFGLDQVANLAS